MNFQKLKEAIEQYKDFLRNNLDHDPMWIWESQKIFQENWDLEAIDLYGMFDRSLQNSKTRRLWKRENHEPKAMMLKFIEMNREYARQVFQDLFNEKKEVDGRLDRFVFHCDEMLREFQDTHPATKLNAHYHGDNYQMASIYLAFRYPELYVSYDFTAFRKLMEILGSRDVPKVNDTGRFFKIMRTLYGFLLKDEEVAKIHRERLDPAIHYEGDSLLLVGDFYSCLTST